MTGATRYTVLAAVCAALFLPAALDAQMIVKPRVDAMNKYGWKGDDATSARVDVEWFASLVEKAQWTPDNEFCEDHRDAMPGFLRQAPMYYAEDKLGGRDGQTLRVQLGAQVEFIVVFALPPEEPRTDEDWLNLLLHEGWHWLHNDTTESPEAGRSEGCAWIPLEEEDEDDDPECGDGADCGGDPTPTPTCEEKARWVTKTEWVWEEKWESEWEVAWREVDENGNIVFLSYVEVLVDNGFWKEVSTRELETYTECSN